MGLGWGAQPHSRRGGWGASPWAVRAPVAMVTRARPPEGLAGMRRALARWRRRGRGVRGERRPPSLRPAGRASGPPARARPAGPWRRQVRARGGLPGCRGPGAPLANARVTFPRCGPPRPPRHAPRAAAPPRCRLPAAAGARSAGRRGSTMALTLFGECGPRLPAAGGPRPGVACGLGGARGGRAALSGLLERGPARRSHCLLSGRAMGVSSRASPGVGVNTPCLSHIPT